MMKKLISILILLIISILLIQCEDSGTNSNKDMDMRSGEDDQSSIENSEENDSTTSEESDSTIIDEEEEIPSGDEIGAVEIMAVSCSEGYYNGTYPQSVIVSKKRFPIYTNEVIDIGKIWKMAVVLDTTIYKPTVSVCTVDSGGVILIDNKYWGGLDGWHRTFTENLSKECTNEVEVSNVYFFQTRDNITNRCNMKISFWVYKKDGNNEVRTIEIENPADYYIPISKASTVITKSKLQINEPDLNKIKQIDIYSNLYNTELYDKYFVALGYVVKDNSTYQRHGSAFIISDYRRGNCTYVSEYLEDFNSYIFVFER